jgi:plasmid stabilization system protein ParE
MQRHIEWATQAQNELQQLIDHYQTLDPDLAAKFFFAVDQAMQLLAKFPKIAPRWHEHYRRLFLQRFPFFIVYCLTDDKIYVLALFPARDDAQKLSSMLKKR